LIYTTEKTLNENREKIPVSEISPIEEALAEGKKALESQDMDRIRKAMDQLTKASHKLAETMYKEAQARSASSARGPEGDQQASPPPGDGGKPEGDVVDAEFEDLGKK
jgi:molecular chaperone DnaK